MTDQVAQARVSPSRSTSSAIAPLVLLVEDDAGQRDALTAVLGAHGYRVEAVASGAAALATITTCRPDVTLVDLGLPDIDGVELCRHLRLRHHTPLIVVTADELSHRMVAALDTGADDYVLKPYDVDVLLARVRVALRHRIATVSLAPDEVVRCGDVVVDVGAHQVVVGGELIDVLPRQFDLLVALMRSEGRVLTYATLARIVWGTDADGDHHSASLRTAISRIRRVLGDGPGRPTLETERHVGYRLIAPSVVG